MIIITGPRSRFYRPVTHTIIYNIYFTHIPGIPIASTGITVRSGYFNSLSVNIIFCVFASIQLIVIQLNLHSIVNIYYHCMQTEPMVPRVRLCP